MPPGLLPPLAALTAQKRHCGGISAVYWMAHHLKKSLTPQRLQQSPQEEEEEEEEERNADVESATTPGRLLSVAEKKKRMQSIVGMATTLRKQGFDLFARAQYEQAVRLWPGTPPVHMLRALALPLFYNTEEDIVTMRACVCCHAFVCECAC